MKKFITLFIIAIFASIFASNASAQYTYNSRQMYKMYSKGYMPIQSAVSPQASQNVQQASPVNLYELPEYWEAASRERRGRNTFYIGLGIETIGAVIATIPCMTDDYYYSDAGIAAGIIGGLISAGGAVTSVVGACKWISGASDKRDIVVAFSMNRLVVTF